MDDSKYAHASQSGEKMVLGHEYAFTDASTSRRPCGVTGWSFGITFAYCWNDERAGVLLSPLSLPLFSPDDKEQLSLACMTIKRRPTSWNRRILVVVVVVVV
jgi:hypothetical protein